MAVISSNTAGDLWRAHREIQVATKLLADILDAIAKGEPPTPRDVFGRQPRAFEFGVPSGVGGHRLFDVPPKLAEAVIRAHIAEKEKELAVANEVARVELNLP